MSFKARLPLEVVVKIAKILYNEECFVELETLMYTFPELNETLSYRIPTVALVDDDQYDIFSKFVHSRERPYGSRDLFIIKQQSTFKWSLSTRVESKCYMILGSKCHQESILQEFKLLRPFVTLVENKKLIEMYCDKSFKCYELVCDPEADHPFELRLQCTYSYHVALMLNTFLKPIDPRLLRFEAYSGKLDLFFEWSDLYDLYRSLVNLRHNRYDTTSDHFTNPSRKDCVVNDPPRCSFELIKDINKLTSLYQFSKLAQPDTWEWTCQPSHPVIKTWLKRKLGHKPTKSINEKFAFFNNVRSMTVEKISSDAQKKSSTSHILIDCTKAANINEQTFLFVRSFRHLISSSVRRRPISRILEPPVQGISITDEQLEAFTNLPLRNEIPFYVDLIYADFLLEKLQTTDITVFVPSGVSTVKQKCLDDSNNLKRLHNLKDWEFQINRKINSIQEVHRSNEKVSQRGLLCQQLSQEVMTTIVQMVKNNSESENLSEEQPLRLRAFDVCTQRVTDEMEWEYIEEWRRRVLDC